jgi:hypothetical protein
VSGRSARDTDEHKEESSSPKPTGETSDAHKDESTHRDKRDTQQKKNDDKKHTSANQQKNKRSKRDVTATTASPGAKKDEKHE